MVWVTLEAVARPRASRMNCAERMWGVAEVANAYYGQFLPMAGSGSVRISVVSQFEISALGGKWTSGYWSHRQCDAQIVPNLTSEQRRLKLL